MTLNIEYDKNEYNSIKNRLIDEEKKSKKIIHIILGIPILILGIIVFLLAAKAHLFAISHLMEAVGCTSIIAGIALIVTGVNIIIYNIYPSVPYERTIFELNHYIFWLSINNKNANDIFAKVDNGNILICYNDAYGFEKYIALHEFFDRLGCEYKNEIPENFNTMNIIAKDGKVNISFS